MKKIENGAYGREPKDGTALIGEGLNYVFFDIFKLHDQKRTAQVEKLFLVHELLHGIHFSQRPEYAPVNYKTNHDHLLKYLINEGAADAGYLYGAEVVRLFDVKNNKGLDFAYKDIELYIRGYFKLDAGN